MRTCLHMILLPPSSGAAANLSLARGLWLASPQILQPQLEEQDRSAVTAGRQGTCHSRLMQRRSGTRPGTAKVSQGSGNGFGRWEHQS